MPRRKNNKKQQEKAVNDIKETEVSLDSTFETENKFDEK